LTTRLDYSIISAIMIGEMGVPWARKVTSSSSSSFLFPREQSIPWLGIEALQWSCLGFLLFNLEALASPPAENLFTPREAAKAGTMGPHRKKAFSAARVALKELSRQLGLVQPDRPDRKIETLGPDGVRPCLAGSGLYCSVSHSQRFVVTVAHEVPVGVDIEAVSKKITTISHLFLTAREETLISKSPLPRERTATRVWTIKESAAKAFGLHLFEALRAVEVVEVDREEGIMRYQGKVYPVRMGEGDGQVVALITRGARRVRGPSGLKSF
jgi:phosphopantetheinyl transferase